MRFSSRRRLLPVAFVVFALYATAAPRAQRVSTFTPPPTIVPADVLDLVRNEVSGQLAYNLEVMLAGYNRVRTKAEFTDGLLYEADYLHNHLKQLGLDDLRAESLDKRPDGWWVASDAELWLVKPERRRLGRLPEDPALVARGSDAADVEAPLVYVDRRDLPRLAQMDLKGKILLTPENSGYLTQALDLGALGLVSYYDHAAPVDDPDQVNFDMSMARGKAKPVFCFKISPRVGYELRERLFNGETLVVKATSKVENYPFKLDTVFAAIKGTNPDLKGLMFTAHLFERPAKIGANDNISGCVVLAEVARTLNALIRSGRIPRPERSVYFLWTEEGSGTLAFFKKYPEIGARLFGAINMDMVGENLDANNAFFNVELPIYSRSSFLPSVVKDAANYVFETNTRRYYYDRVGNGDYPVPILERRGTRQAFKFTMSPFAGGSDHVVFLESDSGIPALSFNVWPDAYYHTDNDTVDKSDPTQLKRVAFIAATSALAMTSGREDTLQALARSVFEDRLGFMQVALTRSIAALDAAADDGGATYRYGAANIGEAERLTEMAFGGVRELARDKKGAAAYLDLTLSAVKALSAAHLDQFRAHYAAVATLKGYKPQPASRLPAADAALQSIVPVRPRVIALGDRFPYQDIFPALQKNQAFQTRLFTTYGMSATGILQELMLWADGKRTLAQIRTSLEFEFGRRIAPEDLQSMVKVLEDAKLLEHKTLEPARLKR